MEPDWRDQVEWLLVNSWWVVLIIVLGVVAILNAGQ